MCKFCWNKQFLILLFLALVANAQEQKRLAILRTVDDGDPPVELTDLNYLTVRLREIAGNVLQNRYGIMTEQSIIDKLGKDNAVKACKEAEGCLAKLGRKINADYIGQARLGRFGGNLTISVELYNSATGLQVSTTISGEAKDVAGLLAVLNTKAPGMFGNMPGVPSKKASSPVVAGGISGIQTTGGDYEMNEKRYLVNLSTEPSNAVLSFNGVPSTSCTQTPCKLELAEGNVRIVAVLEQYERADTTVFIKQNNQNITIKLKPNFGVLEIKPAYLDGIGKDEQWSLAINGKAISSLENKLSPNKYKVELNHRCYEALSFEVGINKGKNEVFDMAEHIKLKKGGLILSAEKNGEPVSEPVFVNGKRVGETPFSGAVPLCAKVEIGKNKEIVDVKLKYNENVKYTYKINIKFLTDNRNGKKYKIVTIGEQTWMAENLNYNASGSKCYDNDLANCGKFGRLYNWNTAKVVCPKGWHLPTKDEWEVLTTTIGGSLTEGKYLKTTSNNGEDMYGFSALSGGYGSPSGDFENVGSEGNWLVNSIDNSGRVYVRYMGYYDEYATWDGNDKSYLFSVRCLQGSPPATQTNTADYSYSNESYSPPTTQTNTASHSYSSEPYKSNSNSFTDSRDGKKYKIVTIGKQTWMAENLNYNASGSKCYDNQESNCQKYGRLYNWETAKKACPGGWHLPSKDEYVKLDDFVGGSSTAGKFLKAKSGWNNNGNGEDKFGFSALPGGSFNYVGDFGYWWSSSESTAYNAYYRYMSWNDDVDYDSKFKDRLQSVRCLKD